jgi:hypothetical protein
MLSKHILRLIIDGLAVRYNIDNKLIKRYLSHIKIVEWAGVRHLGGGDTMYSSTSRESWLSRSEDYRDATCIRVSLNLLPDSLITNLYLKYDAVVDQLARNHHADPIYVLKKFYGRLNHIFLVMIPATEDLGFEKPEEVIFAGIQTFNVVGHNKAKMPLIKGESTFDVVDLSCLQCLIGRVPVGGGTEAVIDRTGSIQSAILVNDLN